jgi:hypothetical protein
MQSETYRCDHQQPSKLFDPNQVRERQHIDPPMDRWQPVEQHILLERIPVKNTTYLIGHQ